MKTLLIMIFVLSFSIVQALDYTIPPNTYSIQSGDFDNDGDNDIVVGHIIVDTYATILENIEDGEFEVYQLLTNPEARMFYFIENFDENPLKDFVIQNEEGNLLIYYNSNFNIPSIYEMQIEAGFNKIASGDFDGDGDYDLVFSSSGAGLDNLWGLMYNLGNRNFSNPEWFECPNQASNADFEKFECHDLDNNGFDDIIAFSFTDTYIYYFSEQGFVADSLDYQIISSGMTSSDFDYDGDYDIVIIHWPSATEDNFKIYENLGNQDFILHNNYCETLWSEPISCDLNNDNLVDIVTIGDEINKYFNEGNFQFSEVIIQDYPDYGESWVEQSFSDFDENGTIDLAIIRYGIEENNLTILYNDGEGNFLYEPQVGIDNNEIILNNERIKLSNYPNPFNPQTTITYSIKKQGFVELNIYNAKGRLIKQLICKKMEGGEHNVTWNGKDQNNQYCSSGIYLIELKVDAVRVKNSRLILLK